MYRGTSLGMAALLGCTAPSVDNDGETGGAQSTSGSGTGDSSGGAAESTGADTSTGTTPEDSDSGDGGSETGADDPVQALVDAIALQYVDPTGRDTSKTVGMVVVAIMGEQQGVYSYGAREIGGPPADADTHFSIASVSKVFAGLGIARRVATDELALEDPVNNLLGPDLAFPERDGQPITLEHLLTHYSGLPGLPVYRLDRDIDGILDNRDADPDNDIPLCCPVGGYTRADLELELEQYADGALELESTPGTEFLYSNHGNGTLNLILADRFGYDSGEAALRDLVFDPLGMDDTATHVEPFVSEAQQDAAVGYQDMGDGMLVALPFLDVGVFAGDVISTGNDMLRFLDAFVTPDASPWPEAVELVLEPLRPTGPGRFIGYALDIAGQGTDAVYAKGGSYRGAKAFVIFTHDPPVGVVVMTNNGSEDASARVPAMEIHEALTAAVAD